MILTATHFHGVVFMALRFEQKWYSKDELETALSGNKNFSQPERDEILDVFSPITYDHSVQGNMLTTIDDSGKTDSYTRR